MLKKNRKQNDNSSRNLSRVDNFLAEISIVTGILVKQSPVHADVPDERVTRAGECRHNPDIEESTAGTAHLITWLHWSNMNTHGHYQYTGIIRTVITSWWKTSPQHSQSQQPKYFKHVQKFNMWQQVLIFYLLCILLWQFFCYLRLQCFDAVGMATGRVSGLKKPLLPNPFG